MLNLQLQTKLFNDLLTRAFRESQEIGMNVRNLIQSLIDRLITAKAFVQRLQIIYAQAHPQPSLVHFLEENLPTLRQLLFEGELVINGISPPPYTACQVLQSVPRLPLWMPSSISKVEAKCVQKPTFGPPFPLHDGKMTVINVVRRSLEEAQRANSAVQSFGGFTFAKGVPLLSAAVPFPPTAVRICPSPVANQPQVTVSSGVNHSANLIAVSPLNHGNKSSINFSGSNDISSNVNSEIRRALLYEEQRKAEDETELVGLISAALINNQSGGNLEYISSYVNQFVPDAPSFQIDLVLMKHPEIFRLKMQCTGWNAQRKWIHRRFAMNCKKSE